MSQRIIPCDETITLAGRTLTIGALSDRQHVELDRWVGSQMIRAAARSLPEDDPLWDRVVAVATAEAINADWQGNHASRGDEGYAHIIFVSVKDKAVTEAEVSALLREATRAEKKLLNDAFMRLNYPIKREVAEGDSNPHAPA